MAALLVYALAAWVPPLAVRSSTCRVGRAAAAPVALGPFGRDEGRNGAIGGAVLGSLIAGPFGALWGASLGNSIGGNQREMRKREEQLALMGLDRETRAIAQRLTDELAEAESGVAICTDAERSQLNFVEQLRASATDYYTEAEARLRAGDEDGARDKLFKRRDVLDKLEEAEKVLREAEERTASMRRSVNILSSRAKELEASFKSAIANRAADSGSRAAAEANVFDAYLPPEDLLLRRFKDLGGR
jgi:hypothetical protein